MFNSLLIVKWVSYHNNNNKQKSDYAMLCHFHRHGCEVMKLLSISSSTEARWSGSRIRQNSTNSHRFSEKYFLGIVGGSSIATYRNISNGAISGWSNWSGGRWARFSHPAGGRDIDTSIWWSVSGGIGYFPIAISIREITKLQRSLLRVYSEPRCENMISTTTTTTTTHTPINRSGAI